MASEFPPHGWHCSTYKSKVYTLRIEIDVRIIVNPEKALADYLTLLEHDRELAEWVAAHVCMLRAGAKKGQWMKTEQAQRKGYALQLQRRLENPNEPECYQIE